MSAYLDTLLLEGEGKKTACEVQVAFFQLKQWIHSESARSQPGLGWTADWPSLQLLHVFIILPALGLGDGILEDTETA